MGVLIVGIFCMAWAVITAIVAFAKPRGLWESGKLAGFVKMLGNTGTTIMLLVLAAGVGFLGVWLTFLR